MVELVIVSLVVVGLVVALALQARSRRADRTPADPRAQAEATRRDDHSGYGPA